MRQLFLTACLLLAGLVCHAETNADIIEAKMIEYGRMLNNKQNVYYFIGEDGKISNVEMSSTIEPELRMEITEFFKSLPAFPSKGGRDMVTIVPSEGVQKAQGYVSQEVSGVKVANDSMSNRVLATADAVKKSKEIKKNNNTKEPKVYDKVDKMPYVIGGKAKWGNFLNENLVYPDLSKEYGAQGRVLVTFIVERDGTTSHVTPVKSGDPYLEKEAVRLIQNMPKWMPGVNQGTVCRVRYTLGINFRLNR